MFRSMLRTLLRWLHIIPRPRFVVRYVGSQVDAARPPDHTIVVVRQAGHEKWACFLCPGECGVKIMLSLAKQRNPHWTVESDWLERPTVHPSVWQQNDCGCHFWVRDGQVVWCGGDAT